MTRLITRETPYVVCVECLDDTRHVCDACQRGRCQAPDCKRRHAFVCGDRVLAEGSVPVPVPRDDTPRNKTRHPRFPRF